MRQLRQIRHNHLVETTHFDDTGEEIHSLFSVGDRNPEAVIKTALDCRGNDRELSIRFKTYERSGAKVLWEHVGDFSTLAQAYKAGKTRLMLMELSADERREIQRAIAPLMSEETDTGAGTDNEPVEATDTE